MSKERVNAFLKSWNQKQHKHGIECLHHVGLEIPQCTLSPKENRKKRRIGKRERERENKREREREK